MRGTLIYVGSSNHTRLLEEASFPEGDEAIPILSISKGIFVQLIGTFFLISLLQDLL